MTKADPVLSFENSQPKAKKKRLRGSCDACRKKKSTSCCDDLWLMKLADRTPSQVLVDQMCCCRRDLTVFCPGDSAEMSGNVCTSCKIGNVECTHDLPRQLTVCSISNKSIHTGAYDHN